MQRLLAVVTVTLLLTLRALAQPASDRAYDVTLRHIDTSGASLAGYTYVPRQKAGDRLPLIILPNSWAANQNEYAPQAAWFARHGYVAFTYSARGFHPSTGTVDVGGAADMDDISRIIDWLLANTPADPARVGMAGISYGAGLSLLGAAHDSRIKTVAVLSGWAELLPSPDANAPREAVSDEGAGPAEGWTPPVMFTRLLAMYARGKRAQLSRDTQEVFDNIMHYRLTRKMREWARERSTLQHVDDYNGRDVRILLSSNTGDRQFRCGDMWTLYRQLRGTKRMLINQGQHGVAEGLEADGMLCDAPNSIWDDVHAWFEQYLKEDGATSSRLALHGGKVLVRPYGLAGTSRPCYSLVDLPRPPVPLDYYVDLGSSTEIQHVSYYLGQGACSGTGLLAPQAASTRPTQYRLTEGLTVATSGVHRSPLMEILSGDTSTFDVAWMTLSKVVRPHTAVLVSAPLPQEVRLRGEPELTVWITVGSGASQKQPPPPASGKRQHPVAVQVIAYLCDVDEHGVGRLVSYSPYTLWSQAKEPGTLQQISIRMNLAAHDVAAGHSLALLVGTEDPQYGMHEAWQGFSQLTLHTCGADGQPGALVLPVLPTPAHL